MTTWLTRATPWVARTVRLVRVEGEFATFRQATLDEAGEFVDVEGTEFTLKVGDYLALNYEPGSL